VRLLDTLKSRARDRRFEDELRALAEKLAEGRWKRDIVIANVPLPTLAGALLDFEGVFSSFQIPEHPTPAETLETAELLKQLLALQEGRSVENALLELLAPLAKNLPALPEGEDFGLWVSVVERLPNLAAVIDGIVRTALTSPLPRLSHVVRSNLLIASGIDPENPTRRQLVMPTMAREATPASLVQSYLRGTPFVDFFCTPYPFTIPASVRFEHTHIVGGSGHGKTQLLQTLVLRDLDQLQQGCGSIVVIDSQGDMIRTISHLAAFSPRVAGSLADRLVLIDPNDIEHPPCLNLFDFGLDRLGRYSVLEREKLLNGAIALYAYMFGALLGAELTERQGVIFRYLARLLMSVPGATIHTLREFMENPEAARPYFAALEGSARHFFETQFCSEAFQDTRQQILNRLWGILSNAVLERMFSNERNKVNIFEAMNSGKVILINTAKDLLKRDGSAILGRFFIALITQATQERAAIPADRRRATFLYIDEAQDYFDESVGELFNQARKYKVGLIVAHQNLGQFERELLASVMASTAIKLVGGMSARDAAAFAKEMRCEEEFLQSMRKHAKHTEFACFVRNITPSPLRLTVPFGTMENRPRLSEAEYEELLELNRSSYCATAADQQLTRKLVRPVAGFELGRPEVF
jgi:Type IV secretion-system coupling protein DNA-binding domain